MDALGDERLYLRLDGDGACAPGTGSPAGTLRDFVLRPELREHVSHIAVYREDHAAPVNERVLPDGSVHLVFSFGDAPQVDGQPGEAMAAVGASTRPALLTLRGRMHGISVGLNAAAAASLLGCPAHEIAEGAVGLDELWGHEAGTLYERLATARDDRTRIRLLQAELSHRIAACETGQSRQTRAAARLIAEGGGRRALGEVAQAVGLSDRRLQQLFRQHVGLSPRAFGRVARLHGCLRELRRSPAPRWAELAVDAGYFDQSHLVNEFRALCGLTPGLFLARAAVSQTSKTPG